MKCTTKDTHHTFHCQRPRNIQDGSRTSLSPAAPLTCVRTVYVYEGPGRIGISIDCITKRKRKHIGRDIFKNISGQYFLDTSYQTAIPLDLYGTVSYCKQPPYSLQHTPGFEIVS